MRETLFNVLAPRISGARFLDLCAGSGAVGIEALSRGAAHATFVDRSRKMRALIESNLNLCRVTADESKVVTLAASEFLHQALKQASESWDLIFFDPPYADDYLVVIEALGGFASGLLAGDGLLIVEHFHKNDLQDQTGDLHRYRLLKQGDSALSFYEKREAVETSI